MKKIIFSFIAVSLFFATSLDLMGEAEEIKEFNTKVDKVSNNTFIDKEGDKVLEKVYYNSEGDIIEVSVEKGEYVYPVNTEYSTLSSGSYWAHSKSTVTSRLESGWIQLRIYANGFSNSYTDSSKNTAKAIDRISVNTTLIMNGSVEDQDQDSRLNASFANASAKQQDFMIPTDPQYSRSSHTYQNSGTNDVYHTTEAERG